MVARLGIEHGVVVMGVVAGRHGAVADVIVIGGAIGVGVAVPGLAVVAAAVISTRGLVVVHVDPLVGLVIVGSHGKGSLVGIDAVGTWRQRRTGHGSIAAVVHDAKEGHPAGEEKKEADAVSRIVRLRADLQDEDTQRNQDFTQTAASVALASTVK